MSDTSPLTELAGFSGQSPLTSAEPKLQHRAISKISGRLLAKPQRRSVAELLAVVMVLSARTRRLALPPTRVDLDVFTPTGRRAARLIWGKSR